MKKQSVVTTAFDPPGSGSEEITFPSIQQGTSPRAAATFSKSGVFGVSRVLKFPIDRPMEKTIISTSDFFAREREGPGNKRKSAGTEIPSAGKNIFRNRDEASPAEKKMSSNIHHLAVRNDMYFLSMSLSAALIPMKVTAIPHFPPGWGSTRVTFPSPFMTAVL